MKNIIEELYNDPKLKIETCFEQHGIVDDGIKRQIWLGLHERVSETLQVQSSFDDYSKKIHTSTINDIVNRLETQYLNIRELQPEQHLYKAGNQRLMVDFINGKLEDGKHPDQYKDCFAALAEHQARDNKHFIAQVALSAGWTDVLPDIEYASSISLCNKSYMYATDKDAELIANHSERNDNRLLVDLYLRGAQFNLSDYIDEIDMHRIQDTISDVAYSNNASCLHDQKYIKATEVDKCKVAESKKEKIFQFADRVNGLNISQDKLLNMSCALKQVINQVIAVDKLTDGQKFTQKNSKELNSLMQNSSIGELLNHQQYGYHTLSESAKTACDGIIDMQDRVTELQYHKNFEAAILNNTDIPNRPNYLSEQLHDIERVDRYSSYSEHHTSHQEQEIYL